MEQHNNVLQALNAWIKLLNEKGGYARMYGNKPDTYTYTTGKNYYKVIENGGSVFAFVDKLGNIYKPAGWARPAKHVRATLFSNKLPLTLDQLYIRG